jgi:hypothetical protein
MSKQDNGAASEVLLLGRIAHVVERAGKHPIAQA